MSSRRGGLERGKIAIIVLMLVSFFFLYVELYADEIFSNHGQYKELIDNADDIRLLLFPTYLEPLVLFPIADWMSYDAMFWMMHLLGLALVAFLWCWRPKLSHGGQWRLVGSYVAFSLLTNPVLWLFLLYT